MKNLILSLILLFSPSLLYAQIHEPTYIDIGEARNGGSAQIGLNVAKDYNTNIQLTHDTWGGSHAILFNAYRNATNITGNLETTGDTKYANDIGNYNGGAGAIMFFGNGGNMDFLISPESTGQGTDIVWGTPEMRIRRNGNVGINTANPTEKLTVNGGIRAEEVTVTEDVGADFVFEEEYELLELEVLQKWIEKHKHLPGVPSAETMKREGVNMGALQMKMLQKIEELTLYVIELKYENKRIKEEFKQIRSEQIRPE